MNTDYKLGDKTGLPPGTTIYIGNKKPEPTSISILTYSDDVVTGFSSIKVDNFPIPIPPDTFTWIQINGLKDIDLIEKVLTSFSVHPLIIEDVLNTKTRSKIDEFNEYIFVVMANLKRTDNRIQKEQVSIIFNKEVLITCSESSGLFTPIETRIKHANNKFKQNGIDYLAYSIIDLIVDGYFSIVEGFEEDIEDLDDELINCTDKNILNRIQEFRHDLIWFRRLVWALRELVIRLERTESRFISNSTHLYLRDVYDHGIKISEDVDVYREMAENLMELYLSNMSNRTNDIMKVLTIITTIFMPLSFIAGIYGMNFEYMPEKSSSIGYPVVLISMVIIALTMVLLFRRKKWI